jgi:hypothetical protein
MSYHPESGRDGNHVNHQHITAYIARVTTQRTPNKKPLIKSRPSAECAQSQKQIPSMVTKGLNHNELLDIVRAEEAREDPSSEVLAGTLSVALSLVLPSVVEAIAEAGAEILCVAPFTTT